MKIKNEVVCTPWGFEVWSTTYDDKGKQIGKRQSGAAVCGPEAADVRRAMALMDPFLNPPVRE